MQSFKVKFDLMFTESLVLYKFLPENERTGLHLSAKNGRYSINVYMTDRSRQLEYFSKSPTTPEELSKQPALMCKGFTIEILDVTPEPALLQSIDTNNWTETTRGYVAELVKLAFEIHNGIVEYFRNLGHQSWLESKTPDGVNAQKNIQFVLDELRAQWFHPELGWQRLNLNQRSLMMQFRPHFMDGVDITEWQEVENFVQAFLNDGKRASVIDVLIANSLQHLAQQNGRLAVIEAVIALEGMLVVKGGLSKVLADVNHETQLDSKLIDKLVEKTGLRLGVKVLLKANAKRVGIDDDDIDDALEAIEVRNGVIHQKRNHVDLDKAKNYVFVIRRIIARLRGKNVLRRAQGEIIVDFN